MYSLSCGILVYNARYVHRYKDCVLWNFSPVNEINGVS